MELFIYQGCLVFMTMSIHAAGLNLQVARLLQPFTRSIPMVYVYPAFIYRYGDKNITCIYKVHVGFSI